MIAYKLILYADAYESAEALKDSAVITITFTGTAHLTRGQFHLGRVGATNIHVHK